VIKEVETFVSEKFYKKSQTLKSQKMVNKSIIIIILKKEKELKLSDF
jgi:hypothetical protein